MLLSRRQALAGLGGLSAAGLTGRAACAGSPVTMIEPYGPESSTGDAAALLQPALSGSWLRRWESGRSPAKPAARP
jgi:hypothetical protein